MQMHHRSPLEGINRGCLSDGEFRFYMATLIYGQASGWTGNRAVGSVPQNKSRRNRAAVLRRSMTINTDEIIIFDRHSEHVKIKTGAVREPAAGRN